MELSFPFLFCVSRLRLILFLCLSPAFTSLSLVFFFNTVLSAAVDLYVMIQRNSRCAKYTKWKMALQRPISHWNSDIWSRFSHMNQKHTSICPPKTHTFHVPWHHYTYRFRCKSHLHTPPLFAPLSSEELHRLIHRINVGDGCNFNDPNLNRFGEKEMPHFIHAHRKWNLKGSNRSFQNSK